MAEGLKPKQISDLVKALSKKMEKLETKICTPDKRIERASRIEQLYGQKTVLSSDLRRKTMESLSSLIDQIKTIDDAMKALKRGDPGLAFEVLTDSELPASVKRPV